MSTSIVLHLLGLALLFLGERLFGPDTGVRVTLDVLGALAIAGGLVLRGRALLRADGDRRRAHRLALLLGVGSVVALLVYVLTVELVAASLGLDPAGRTATVLGVLWPLALLLTTLPMVLVDLALGGMPAVVQPLRVRHALETGLLVALALALAFPVNFLAERHHVHTDLRFVKTTSPGTSTRALVAGLSEPVQVVLFFPPANEVHAQVRPYFEALAKGTELLVVEDADQALHPDKAKDLRIASNGAVALVRGESVERINLGTDLGRARGTLKKFDATVQQHLLQLTRAARTVYVTTGHGEAHWAGGEGSDPDRRVQGLKRLLENLNLKVAPLGLREGLGRAIPDDAAAVLVLGPTQPFLPEEVAALSAYADRGGRLLLAFDPAVPGTTADEPDHAALAALGGVRFHPEVLHNAQYHLQRSRTPADQALLVTNRFSSHPTMSTLSRNAQRVAVVTVSAGWLEALDAAATGDAKATDTLRTMPGTWADADGDHAAGAGEPKQTFALAMALSRAPGGATTAGDAAGGGDAASPGTAAAAAAPTAESRVAALADVDVLTDVALGNQGNLQYAVDTLRWLTGDEALSGTVESEEDVRIEHTREQDAVWFYGSTFAIPALVLLGGVVWIRRRRRS